MVKRVEYKRRRNPLLPIFGAILAIAFGVIAYVLLPYVQRYLRTQGISFGTLSPLASDLLVGAVLWLVMFGVSMFIVAILAGRDYDEDVALSFTKESARYRERQRAEKERKQQLKRKLQRESREHSRRF
ncbi:MAG: hypothetical protein HPY64_14330 [Anaerolineae bacterium]|nr:hypothetical protein [Anaerolineae bacterium]